MSLLRQLKDLALRDYRFKRDAHEEILRLLEGGDANAISKRLRAGGLTGSLNPALIHAVQHELPMAVIHVLLNSGADPNALSKEDGTSAWHWASDLGYIDKLLQHGANPKLLDRKGRNLLHWLVMFGCQELVEPVILRGVPFDQPDKEDWTPLCFAVRHGLVSVVETLLSKGAKPNAICHKLSLEQPKKPYLGDKKVDPDRIRRLLQNR